MPLDKFLSQRTLPGILCNLRGCIEIRSRGLSHWQKKTPGRRIVSEATVSTVCERICWLQRMSGSSEEVFEVLPALVPGPTSLCNQGADLRTCWNEDRPTPYQLLSPCVSLSLSLFPPLSVGLFHASRQLSPGQPGRQKCYFWDSAEHKKYGSSGDDKSRRTLNSVDCAADV